MEDLKVIKEIIVVEGKDDTTAVKRAVGADTIETNGSAINEETISQIRHAQQKRGVIIFTDPDYPGQRIRSMIDQQVKGCKHAFLPREKAISKKGLGIEHASDEAIREALETVYERIDHPINEEFTKMDLIDFGLIGFDQAKDRRKRLGNILHIGFVNGKQLIKRLNMFQISRQEFEEAMETIYQEEQRDG
ncbi:ribonuclease M5 [Bacillaceae bacterium S4-13-56]